MSLLGYINNGLNQSLNGIVTITDGNGTVITDGSVSSNSMTVSNFTATAFNATNLTITGSITLPNGSILDVYLTSNIPKKNATNTYTALNTFNGGLTVSSGTSNFNENLNMNSSKIITFKDNFTTISQTNVSQYNGSFYIQNYADPNISGGYIIQYVKNLSNIAIEGSVLNYVGYYLKNGISIFIYNASNTNYLKLEQYLFNSYISNFAFDSAITPYLILRTRNSAGTMIENVKLSPTLTQITTNLTCSNGLTVSGSLVLPSNSILDSYLSSNVCLLNATQTLLNKTINTGAFTGTSTFNNNISIRNSSYIELFNSTNLISSYISQISNNLDIHNYGSGSIVLNSPSVDMTNAYTYISGAEMISGNSFTQYDSTNTYGTSFRQSSTNYIIENQYNSGQIILRNKNTVSSNVDYIFSYNGLTIPTLLTCNNGLTVSNSLTLYNNAILDSYLSSNVPLKNTSNTFSSLNTYNSGVTISGGNLTQTGTSYIDQSSSTGQNIFNTLRFNNSTSNKHITLYQNSPTNLVTNYTISIEPSTLRYNVALGGSHIFSVASSSSTYSNTLTINSSGLTLLSNTNINESGTSIISQTGTGINLMKNITMNADNNILMSGIGIIQQSGQGTNALKSSTFSGNNTHFNGGQILQYDLTNAVYTTLSQATTNSYLIENNYNSSSIYLRNKNTTGGSVDYIFSYNSMTIPTPLTINNNLIIPDYNLVLKHTSNQSNIFQFNTGLYFWNLNNSGTITHRVKNNTGSDVDTITTNSTYTTINTLLECNKNITLPPSSGYFIPTSTTNSYELGFQLTGTITMNPLVIPGGIVQNIGNITIPWGVWNLTAVFSFYVSTNGNITTQKYSLSTNATTNNTQQCEQLGGEAMTTAYYKIKRLHTTISRQTSITLYMNMELTASSGVYQFDANSLSYCQLYAIRIA